MTITLELPDSVEAELQAQAHARGMALDAYLIQHVLPAAVEKPKAPRERKSLAQLFSESPLQGLDLPFERSQDTGRPIPL